MTTTVHADGPSFMRLAVDRMPSMLAYWDRNLTCRFANRACEAWFGVDPDGLIGKSIRDLLNVDQFEMNEPHMRAALAGERQNFERIVPGLGGVQRYSLTEYMPDQVEGVVRGFLVQVTDVTDLKVTQAALHRESQLRIQFEENSRRLEALLKERTEMLDVLAHEVRQPLNNASAALQNARGAIVRKGDESAAEQVVRAQAVLGEVQSSIDNTLTVASLLARPDRIQHDDADVDSLIEIAIADMPAGERGRIQVHRDTTTRTALMDMSLMRLTLRNLISNALKFSLPGSSVQVRVADCDEPLALLLDVSDVGAGIPTSLLPRLFTRGARGDGNKVDGMGLGLYIVDRLMSLHGGAVELVRTGVDGTTFRLVVTQLDSDD